ncbi:hypothetical protein FSP39_004279 [Pinctada imbricata]|uniref:Dynein regulatory complex protein 12 n=1 Tax=Pinctada imbricata TaxID=66713 RepID=A0AA88YKD6_PINIB|nr:hypothetical protein FSP39_004279 [Pinctada imbricata]
MIFNYGLLTKIYHFYTDATLELDDRYKKTMMEIEALKDNLAIRKELSQRNQLTSDTMKAQMADTASELEKHKQDQRDINAAMTQQYNKMQTDKSYKIHYLERELMQTQKQLRETEKKLKETEDEKERIIKEKDEEIAD